jgi:cation diffusion facilitator family transporter
MPPSSRQADARLRLFGGLLSLGLGLAIMAMKFLAYRLTGSTALLSDALESVVNVVAAAFALWAVRAAEAPPDPEHPYGHGKLEFVTAVFEGGLISFAALMIGYEAVVALLRDVKAPNLDQGLWIVGLAGLLNGLLGFALIAIGRRTRSAALVADGKHVLTDFVTTIGIIVGLALVKITGFAWLDPLIALVMAALLASTGVPLVKEAISGLIDAADETLLEKMLISFEKHRRPGIIRLHHVRAMRNGRRIHVDGHVVVPEFWTVDQAHEETEAFEGDVVADSFSEGEMEFHLDPCRQAYCRSCEVAPCPIRLEAFAHRPPLNLLELLSPVDITDRPQG